MPKILEGKDYNFIISITQKQKRNFELDELNKL